MSALPAPAVCSFPRTDITSTAKWGLGNRNLLSLSSGGPKSKIEESAGLVSSEGGEGDSVPALSPSFW